MKNTVSRTLTPTRRAGFTAFGDPGRAASTARKAATVRRENLRDYTGTAFAMSSKRPVPSCRLRYPQSPVAGRERPGLMLAREGPLIVFQRWSRGSKSPRPFAPRHPQSDGRNCHTAVSGLAQQLACLAPEVVLAS